jgi:hypothetical protein
MSSWQRVLIGLTFIVIISGGGFQSVLEDAPKLSHFALVHSLTSQSLPPEWEESLVRISGGVDDGCYTVGVNSWFVRSLC